jgi:hypothetical protein
MQALQDESDSRPSAADAGGAQGVDKDSDRVELRGTRGLIGYCNEFSIVKNLNTKGILWQKITSPAFFFHQASAILVIQGLMLQDLFPPSGRFVYTKNADEPIGRGPFILLKGELATAGDPPLRLKNMVLASLLEFPANLAKEEFLGSLLRAIQ